MDHRLKCEPKSKKYLEEKYRRKYWWPCMRQRLLRYDIQSMRDKRKTIDKLELIKIRTAFQNALIRKWTDKSHTWRKYLWITYLIKGSYPACIRNSQNSVTIRKNPIKNAQKIWIDTSPKKDIQKANKLTEWCSVSLVIRKMLSKTTMR